MAKKCNYPIQGKYTWDNKSKKVTFRLSAEDFESFEKYCKQANKSKQEVLLTLVKKQSMILS